MKLTLGTLLTLLLWLPRLAGAAPPETLLTPVAQALFESRPGLRVMRGLVGGVERAGPEYSVFLKRLSETTPEMNGIRRELEAVSENTTELLEEYRALKTPERAGFGSSAPLTRDERAVVSEIARRKLRINPAWSERLLDSSPNFVGGGTSYEEARTRFLAEESATPASSASVGAAAGASAVTEEGAGALEGAAAEERARSGVQGFFSEMRSCVKNSPPGASKKNRLRHQLIQIGISSGQTILGHVTSSCTHHVEWKNLSSDLMIGILASSMSSRFLTGATTFKVRMVKVATFGQGRAAFDAAYYYVTPLKETHGQSEGREIKDRYFFNSAWSVATTPISVGIYSLVSGLECLYPGSKTVALTTGIRIASSTATSLAYFKLRRHFVGSHSTDECAKK